MLNLAPRLLGPMAAVSLAGALLMGLSIGGAQGNPSDGEQRAQEVLGALAQEPGAREGRFADRGALLEAGFAAFQERYDVFDAEAAKAVAKALFQEDPAVWSAFCVEGVLRRGAAEGAEEEAFSEASAVLRELQAKVRGSASAELAVIQRRALLAAGFGRPDLEAASLGAALGRGGVDGIQILALKALTQGDHDQAARLFGSLIDRFGEPPPQGAKAFQRLLQNHFIAPGDAPWALRGHALATLEALRAQ